MSNFGKNLALWVIIGLLLVALFNLFQQPGDERSLSSIPFSDFLAEVSNGQIREVTIKGNNITGVYTDGRGFQTYTPNDPNLVERLHKRGVVIKAVPTDDGSPSLSVRDLGDRVLIHCFAGCEPAEVMDAVDLSLAELFVQRENHGPMRRRERWDARALLKLLRSEAGIVLIAANDIAEGQTPKPDDYERLRVAVGRIVRVVGVAG